MRNDELYEDELLGYCIYCKEEIYSDDEYVVRAKDYYHVNCFNKLQGLDDYSDDSDYE